MKKQKANKERVKKGKRPYCSKCGWMLDIIRVEPIFDNDTGKELSWSYWKCPKASLFSWGHDTATGNPWTDEISIDCDY